MTPHSYTSSVTQKYSASKRKYTTTTTNNTLMSCQNYQKCAKKLGAFVEYWGRNVKILQNILRLAQNINLKKAHKDVMICDQMNGKYSSYKHSNLTLHLSEPNSKGLRNGRLGPWSKMYSKQFNAKRLMKCALHRSTKTPWTLARSPWE